MGLENHFSVFLRVALLHRFYCIDNGGGHLAYLVYYTFMFKLKEYLCAKYYYGQPFISRKGPLIVKVKRSTVKTLSHRKLSTGEQTVQT